MVSHHHSRALMPDRLSTAADAFWFGPAERRAFGWYHAPTGPCRDMGVVLCPPLGHEMLCTHRAFRHLAARLALLGFPVLRFDYHGTGDSAGSDRSDERVGSWLGTVHDAVDVIRRAGVPRVGLFGMRIGGTLAAVAAAARDDVDALALVAPSTSGGTYLRELRTMHKLRDRGERRPPFEGQRDGDEEVIGFVFRRETIDALAKIDMREITCGPGRTGGFAVRTLLVPRDDIPSGDLRLAERLRTLGATVDVVQAPGYAALAADDPYLSEVPLLMWNAVASWLDGVSPASSSVDVSPRLTDGGTRVVIENGVVESTVWYGPEAQLFAILSEPTATPTDVAVVMSNTGANSRVGPNRFGVTLARRLAARGHGVLRIDLGGVGDSPPEQGAGENVLFATRSIDDVRSAIDALAARGYRRFVAAGVCAGAYMSFHAGLADDRIVGVALMNPPAFEWHPGRKVERIPMREHGFRSTRYYRHRALQLETWRRLARGKVDARGIARALGARLRDRVVTGVKRSALLIGRGDLVMSDLAQKFVALARRDTRVLLLFNGEEPMLDEVNRHLGSLMRWLETQGLQLHVLDDTDHIFAPVWSQERATDLLTSFVDLVARTEKRRLVG